MMPKDWPPLTEPDAPLMTLYEAKCAAKRAFTAGKAKGRAYYLVLLATDEITLLSFGPRGGARKVVLP